MNDIQLSNMKFSIKDLEKTKCGSFDAFDFRFLYALLLLSRRFMCCVEEKPSYSDV